MHIVVLHIGSSGSGEGPRLEFSLSIYGKQIFFFFKPIVHFYKDFASMSTFKRHVPACQHQYASVMVLYYLFCALSPQIQIFKSLYLQYGFHRNFRWMKFTKMNKWNSISFVQISMHFGREFFVLAKFLLNFCVLKIEILSFCIKKIVFLWKKLRFWRKSRKFCNVRESFERKIFFENNLI